MPARGPGTERAIAACRKLLKLVRAQGMGTASSRRLAAPGAVVALPEAMLDHGCKHRLHMLGNDGIAARDQCPGARGAQQADRGARRQARRHPAALRVWATSACT